MWGKVDRDCQVLLLGCSAQLFFLGEQERGQEQISGKAASGEGPESVTGQDGNDLTSTDKGVPGLCLLFSPSICSGNGGYSHFGI